MSPEYRQPHKMVLSNHNIVQVYISMFQTQQAHLDKAGSL